MPIPDTIGIEDTSAGAKVHNVRNMGKTVFGRENRSREFTALIVPHERTTGPGPGEYAHYTNWGHSEVEKLSRSVMANRQT